MTSVGTASFRLLGISGINNRDDVAMAEGREPMVRRVAPNRAARRRAAAGKTHHGKQQPQSRYRGVPLGVSHSTEAVRET